MEGQRLMQDIKTKLMNMTEEQKQKVLDILLGEPSCVCETMKEAV